ncbi:hypothetical protein ACKKBG_A30530 [Auxenochlorella protothecoides x Auxenochlorella symbiontica]
MEELVTRIRTTNATELKSILESDACVQSLANSDRDTLLAAAASLDPGLQSLGCLYLLDAVGRASPDTHRNMDLLAAEVALLENGDASQLQLSMPLVARLARRMKSAALREGAGKSALCTLRKAALRLIPGTKYISPLHADIFQLCILTKNYHAALPFIEHEAYDVDPSKTGSTNLDVLLYCYYGGLVETTRRRYACALWFFECALSVPSGVVSAVTIAAAKKWMLLHVLHKASVGVLPKSAPPILSRTVKSECALYLTAGRHLTVVGPLPDLASWLETSAPAFIQDGNWGLLQLALQASKARAVRRLTKVYTTIAFEKAAELLSLDVREVEPLILRMVDSGELTASIDQEHGTVRFGDASTSQVDSLKQLEGVLERCMAASRRLSAMNQAVQLEQAYMGRTAAGGGAAVGPSAPDQSNQEERAAMDVTAAAAGDEAAST